MSRFYLLDVYDMETGDTVEKTGFPSKYACLNHVSDLEKDLNKELDYYIKEVFLNENTDVFDQ